MDQKQTERMKLGDDLGAKGGGQLVQAGPVVRVESIDGTVLQLQVSGSDTVARVREIALRHFRIEPRHAGKYIMVVAQSENAEDIQRVDENATIDRIIAEGHALNFQLLPQVAFGKGTGGNHA